MHLQQTKAGSRATGGPQYYFHNLSFAVKNFLRGRRTCKVCLTHDLVNVPNHIDVVELKSLCSFLS